MEPPVRSSSRVIAVVFALLLFGLGAVPGARVSQAYDRQMPVLAHYSSEFTPVGFVLDLTGEAPKLKFDNSEEIFVLRWVPAAGGDRLLVREDQFVVLRVSALGGITLFTPQDMRGVPVAPDRRPAQPLRSNAPSIALVRDYAARILAQARAETGRTINFDADWDLAARDPNVRALLFDSIRNAGSALIDWIRRGPGRDAVGTSLRRVVFVVGPPSLPYRQGDRFVITFSPGMGIAGRPSTSVIAQQLAQFARR